MRALQDVAADLHSYSQLLRNSLLLSGDTDTYVADKFRDLADEIDRIGEVFDEALGREGDPPLGSQPATLPDAWARAIEDGRASMQPLMGKWQPTAMEYQTMLAKAVVHGAFPTLVHALAERAGTEEDPR